MTEFNLPIPLAAAGGGGKRGGGGDDKDPMDGFIRVASHHPDEKEAEDMSVEQSGHVWDCAYGAELSNVSSELAELEPQYQQSVEQGDKLRQKQADTDPYNKVSKGKQDTDSAVPLSEWRHLHLFLACLTSVLGGGMLFLGMLGIHANLQASGEPIFLETPMLSWLLSGFLPGFAVAIKCFTLFLPSDRSRRNYSLFIYGLTIIAGIVWIVLFSQQFQGMTSGIDWSDLAAASGHGNWAFTLIQLLGEVLIGASCFLAVEKIASIYGAGYSFVENLERIQINEHSKHQKSEHTPLAERVRHLQGREIQLTASRKAYINSNLIKLRALRTRLNALNNPDFKL